MRDGLHGHSSLRTRPGVPVPATRSETRTCERCGHALSRYNRGALCFACEERARAEQVEAAVAKTLQRQAEYRAQQQAKEVLAMGAPKGFTEADREAMRKARAAGKTYTEIAEAFGCSDVTVRKACATPTEPTPEAAPEPTPEPRTGYCMLIGAGAWEGTHCGQVAGLTSGVTICGPGCMEWREARPEPAPIPEPTTIQEEEPVATMTIPPMTEAEARQMTEALRELAVHEPELERAQAFLQDAEAAYRTAFAVLAVPALGGAMPDLELVQRAYEYGRAEGGYLVLAAMAGS